MTNRTPAQLSLFSAAMIVAASMIGVGVFTTSGFALAELGTPGRVMAAWAVGSVLAFCGAASYAALAAKFSESGGEYLFLARAVHPAAGVTAGVVSLLAGFTGPIAAAAIGLELYLRPMLGITESVPSGAVAVGAIAVAAMLHSIHVSAAARLQDLVVILKLALIACFIVYAAFQIPTAVAEENFGNNETAFSIVSFAKQLVWISFSFAGFNAAIYVAGEVQDPARNVPRALLGGTVLVSVIYLLLNAIFVYSTSPSIITDGQNISQIAATAAMAVGGQALEALVRIVIVTALFTSVSAMVMTGPRVYAKMASDGFLPKIFEAGDRSPAAAIWFQAVLSIAVVLVSRLQDLLGYLGLTLSLCSSLAIASLFLLKQRGQIDHLPGYGIPPAVFIIASVTLAAIASWSQPYPAIAAAITLAIGAAVVYPLTKKVA